MNEGFIFLDETSGELKFYFRKYIKHKAGTISIFFIRDNFGRISLCQIKNLRESFIIRLEIKAKGHKYII